MVDKSYFFFGGNNRARTCDPLLVRQMLSQLSYAPIYEAENLMFTAFLVGATGQSLGKAKSFVLDHPTQSVWYRSAHFDAKKSPPEIFLYASHLLKVQLLSELGLMYGTT